MSQGKTTIENALLRCVREDGAASSLFELVRADLRLWVREIVLKPGAAADVQLQEIGRELEAHRAELSRLAAESRDYILFLSVEADEVSVLKIPHEILRLAADCGFELEVFTQRSGGA